MVASALCLAASARTFCNIGLAISSFGLGLNGTEHHDRNNSIDNRGNGDNPIRRKQCPEGSGEDNPEFPCGRKPGPEWMHNPLFFAGPLALLGFCLIVKGADYFVPRACGERLPTNKISLSAAYALAVIGGVLFYLVICLLSGLHVL